MQVTTSGSTSHAPDTGGDAAANAGANSATDAGANAPLANDLYALVVHTHKNCNADLFEAVGHLELTLTQIKLLHHLDDAASPLTLKEGAELVHVSLPAASRTVDDLVRRGYAGREEDAEDRRMKRVSITAEGRSVIRRLNAARLNGLKQFIDNLNDTERETLARALEQLLERPEVAACRLEP
jgi:DNA-binding MarR family transcriptional regulator